MNMSELIAKPVVKNKFWIVENNGTKIATIQATDDGGCVYVHDDQREHFPSVSVLKKKHNIKFNILKKEKSQKINLIYGFPVTSRFYNEIFDVQKKIALFTKLPKSKSYYCAGYYIIKTQGHWKSVFCPKKITINRYEYFGPYKNETEVNNKIKELNNASN